VRREPKELKEVMRVLKEHKDLKELKVMSGRRVLFQVLKEFKVIQVI
jgi:hypothetical protein